MTAGDRLAELLRGATESELWLIRELVARLVPVGEIEAAIRGERLTPWNPGGTPNEKPGQKPG